MCPEMGAAVAVGGLWQRISDIVLVAPAGSVSFDVPADYGVLLLLWDHVYGDDDATQTVLLTYNGDVGNNYDHSRVDWNANTNVVQAAAAAAISSIGDVDGSEIYAHGQLKIFNRATKQKFAYGMDYYRREGLGVIHTFKGFHIENKWRNVTDEISIITLTPNVGNFVAGSRFILLGIPT